MLDFATSKFNTIILPGETSQGKENSCSTELLSRILYYNQENKIM